MPSQMPLQRCSIAPHCIITPLDELLIADEDATDDDALEEEALADALEEATEDDALDVWLEDDAAEELALEEPDWVELIVLLELASVTPEPPAPPKLPAAFARLDPFAQAVPTNRRPKTKSSRFTSTSARRASQKRLRRSKSLGRQAPAEHPRLD